MDKQRDRMEGRAEFGSWEVVWYSDSSEHGDDHVVVHQEEGRLLLGVCDGVSASRLGRFAAAFACMALKEGLKAFRSEELMDCAVHIAEYAGKALLERGSQLKKYMELQKRLEEMDDVLRKYGEIKEEWQRLIDEEIPSIKRDLHHFLDNLKALVEKGKIVEALRFMINWIRGRQGALDILKKKREKLESFLNHLTVLSSQLNSIAFDTAIEEVKRHLKEIDSGENLSKFKEWKEGEEERERLKSEKERIKSEWKQTLLKGGVPESVFEQKFKDIEAGKATVMETTLSLVLIEDDLVVIVKYGDSPILYCPNKEGKPEIKEVLSGAEGGRLGEYLSSSVGAHGRRDGPLALRAEQGDILILGSDGIKWRFAGSGGFPGIRFKNALQKYGANLPKEWHKTLEANKALTDDYSMIVSVFQSLSQRTPEPQKEA